MHDALAPDGSWLLVGFDVADDLVDNPIAAILYGFSLVYCLPTSLAGDGDGLGTCGLPPSEVQARAATAGFGDVQNLPIENPPVPTHALTVPVIFGGQHRSGEVRATTSGWS